MLPSNQISLATKYLVDDLPGARQIGTRLYGILVKIDSGEPVSEMARAFLLANNLLCLHALVEGRTDFDTFALKAGDERAHRMDIAKIAASEAADKEARLKAERAAASAEIFSDPHYQRRQESKQLKRRFDLGYTCASYTDRERIRAFLLNQDPVRFAWLRSKRVLTNKSAQLR